MTDPHKRSGVLDGIGVVAGTAVVLGPVLGFLRVVPPLAAFATFALGGIVSVIAGLTALVAAARGRGFAFGRAFAVLAALVFLFSILRSGNAPRINDFSTDTDDPPVFVFAASLPANTGRDMAYPAEFEAIQRDCCNDLHAARLPTPPDQALRQAERVAAAMPTWAAIKVDPASGTIEAVAESPLFGFQDDVVIRVRPDGSGSVADVRSKSRDGKGDMGANAARIRAYVAALEQPGAGAAPGAAPASDR
ncbi:MAG: DUF1499 domain-containing protein [Deltaproteobacteria bacterium]|nr:DUF1499 domain-containing protein [Deltaproteobacteria bacterium]